jgi:hypothetical protein
MSWKKQRPRGNAGLSQFMSLVDGQQTDDVDQTADSSTKPFKRRMSGDDLSLPLASLTSAQRSRSNDSNSGSRSARYHADDSILRRKASGTDANDYGPASSRSNGLIRSSTSGTITAQQTSKVTRGTTITPNSVCVLAPIEAISIGTQSQCENILANVSSSMGARQHSMQLYRLVPIASDSKEPITGPVAVAVEPSNVSLEGIEQLLEDNEQLHTNMDRVSGSIQVLTDEVDRLSKLKARNEQFYLRSRNALEDEITALRRKLKQSLEIRKENQLMLDALRSEFEVLVSSMTTSPSAPMNRSISNESKSSTPTLCAYQLLVEMSVSPESDIPVFLKLLGTDNRSDNIQLPFDTAEPTISETGIHVFEFDCDAASFPDLAETWVWREDGDLTFPKSVRSVFISTEETSRHPARQWKFYYNKASQNHARATNSKYSRLFPQQQA